MFSFCDIRDKNAVFNILRQNVTNFDVNPLDMRNYTIPNQKNWANRDEATNFGIPNRGRDQKK